jgi:hypothetical protein
MMLMSLGSKGPQEIVTRDGGFGAVNNGPYICWFVSKSEIEVLSMGDYRVDSCKVFH